MLLTNILRSYAQGLKFAGYLVGPAFLMAILINYKLVIRMFQFKKGSNWIWYTLLNWLFSGALLLSVTHLVSHGSLHTLRELATDDNLEVKIAFGIALVSFTYLVGFFSIALAFVDATSKSKSGLSTTTGFTAFVPPAYYCGVVAIAWRTHATLRYRLFIVLVSMAFFGILNIAWKYKANLDKDTTTEPKKNAPTHENLHKSVPTSGTDRATSTHAAEASTCNYDIRLDAVAQHWKRQLAYDLAVYVMPAVVLAIMVPVLRPLIAVVSMFPFLGPSIYNVIAAYVFLQPTPLEDPAAAAKRRTSYSNPGVHLDGWFRVADSHEIAKGQVKYLQNFDRSFAVFRGQDGYVRCVDAHCIHLGANMAVGGKVVDNCLECPFHRWRYDGTGQCTHIPYQEKIPDATKTKAYYVCEYYGMILLWIHSKDSAPSYYPPNIEKIDSGEMVPRGERHTAVNMHIVEFAENSCDFQHFDPLHGRMAFPFTTKEIPGITVNHRPGWEEGKGDQSHLCWFLDDADLNLIGKHYPETAAQAVITFVGPAGLVFFTFETPIGSIVLFQTHTPVAELRLQVSFQWFASATMPRPLVWYIVGNWIGQWQNDISVWENKIFMQRPVLVRNDGPMMKQRRWWRQFTSSYTELVPMERPITIEKGEDASAKVTNGRTDAMKDGEDAESPEPTVNRGATKKQASIKKKVAESKDNLDF